MASGTRPAQAWLSRFFRITGQRAGSDSERCCCWSRWAASRLGSGSRHRITGALERERVAHEMRELREELAHSDRVSGLAQLASGLAHELGQPLGAILRNAEAAELLIEESPPDLAEIRAILTDIRQDDQRAAGRDPTHANHAETKNDGPNSTFHRGTLAGSPGVGGAQRPSARVSNLR